MDTAWLGYHQQCRAVIFYAFVQIRQKWYVLLSRLWIGCWVDFDSFWTEPHWHSTLVCTLYSKLSCRCRWRHLHVTTEENGVVLKPGNFIVTLLLSFQSLQCRMQRVGGVQWFHGDGFYNTSWSKRSPSSLHGPFYIFFPLM